MSADQTARPRRFPFLDELRGLAIVMMVLYHFLYDLVAFARYDIPLFSPPLTWWQQSIGTLFILLSGCVCRFSRSNPRRGLRCLLGAAAVTVVSFFVLPGQPILFGVLHLLGCAMLLYPLCRPALDRLPALPAAGALLALWWLTLPAQNGRLGWPLTSLRLPGFLYQDLLTMPFGFPPQNFLSADYYPLIPWFFLFCAGSLLGRLLSRHAKGEGWYRSRVPALAFLGRHSFFIYLVHQPLLYGLTWVLIALGNL